MKQTTKRQYSLRGSKAGREETDFGGWEDSDPAVEKHLVKLLPMVAWNALQGKKFEDRKLKV